MTTAKPHPHAAMIVEWIKDTSRIVQTKMWENRMWMDCSLPTWCPSRDYRFADSAIRSSLSDEELRIVRDNADTLTIACRAIADAAAARAIEDIPKLEVRIKKDELYSTYCNFDGAMEDLLISIAEAIVEDCNEQLGKKK